MKKLRKKTKNKANAVERILIKIIIFVMALTIAAFFVSGFDFSKLEVTFYNMRSYKVNESIRVVLISDLHLREFGENNCELLEKVSDLEPDLIAVTGDLTLSGNPDYRVATELLKNLKEIAPVFYSYGNHEFHDILFEEGCTLQAQIASTGVAVLNSSCQKIKIKNTDIVIGGICTNPESFHRCENFLEGFCKFNEFKILLCHQPECFEAAMEGYPVDLALCGHTHGGQIVLPVVGGLYTPDQGFLPEFTRGMLNRCGSTVVISRGLGNSNKIPRYHNDPEIVVVDIGNY